MTVARAEFTATLLNDGRVLAAGGAADSSGTPLASAEIYDPATGTWSPTGSMSVRRRLHTATRLNDGRVLVAGGFDGTGSLSSAEIFDPATSTWSPTGSMSGARAEHTATLLNDSRVLVAGGFLSGNGSLSSAELFNPATGTWAATGSMTIAHNNHTATLLGDGRVLVAGGFTRPGGPVNTSELFDPATGTWSSTGDMVSGDLAGRERHTATLLGNGLVLAAGGFCCGWVGYESPVNTAELYNPATGTWAATSSMNDLRAVHTATLLANGQVLVAGGFCCTVTVGQSDTPPRSSAEIFTP